MGNSNCGGIVGFKASNGTIVNCQWYSEGLDYGIGSDSSNDNATKNLNISMPSIESVINN